MSTAIFIAICFVTLVVQGYLSGRFRELLILDDLHVYRIVDFLSVATATVAYNLGASWWPLPLAVACASVCGHIFIVAVGTGARGAGKRVVVVRDNK